jgi:hypothetical protein
VREGERWIVYRVGAGTRTPVNEIVVPPEIARDGLGTHLNDLLHELVEPGRAVRRVG